MNATVTVIVLAFKTTKRLEPCIRSLYDDRLAPAMDLRILLNAVPSSETAAAKERFEKATVIESPVNLGFAGGCNFAARDVATEFLAFVNDDSRVEEGWLAALLRLAKLRPDAAAIGSRILFPDGTLQEAASEIWRDGSTSPIGRGEPAGSRRYNAVRKAAFCSANGLLVRTADWVDAGGFDEEYYPAYYEDVDLCMTLRHRLSRSVLYEPRSIIRHDLSASSDPRTRAFLFQRHKDHFKEKWRAELGSYSLHRAPGLVGHSDLLKVLIIDDRVPDSGLGSGFGRFASLGLDNSEERFAVSFVATAERKRSAPTLQDAGIDLIPLDALNAALKRERFDVVLASRPHNYAKYVPGVVRRQPWIVKIYDAEALFHVRVAREAADKSVSGGQQGTINRRAIALERTERNICRTADLVVATSADEVEIIRAFGAKSTVLQLPMDPRITATESPFEQRSGILFAAGWLGGSASPNVDALRWIAQNVMPLVWAHEPAAHLYITGANPPTEALSLATDRVIFTGFIEDLRRLYERVRIAAIPTRVGAGTKVKLIEALQYGVPAVATPVGAEGLPHDVQNIVAVKADARQFAEEILSLYRDQALWTDRRRGSLSLADALLAARPTWADIFEWAVNRGVGVFAPHAAAFERHA